MRWKGMVPHLTLQWITRDRREDRYEAWELLPWTVCEIITVFSSELRGTASCLAAYS